MKALFKGGEFVGYSQDHIESPHLQQKEIPAHQQDLHKWKWEGDFVSGKMVPTTPSSLEQEDLAVSIVEEIFKKYPTHLQLPLLIKEIYNISTYLASSDKDFTPHPVFLDMAEKLLWSIDKFKPSVKYLKHLYKN